MGLFDKLKAAVGVGQPTVEIYTGITKYNNQTQFSISKWLNAEIVVTGGARETSIQAIEFMLIETCVVSKKQEDGSIQEEKIEQVIAKQRYAFTDKVLKPGEAISQVGSLDISNARVSGIPFSHKIRASVDCPGLDPKKEMEVFLHY